MSTQRSSFGKLQRDRTKRERAAAKRERRQDRTASPDSTEHPTPDTGELAGRATTDSPQDSTAEILQRIETIHQLFDAGTISYETFEKEKTELFDKLSVD